MSRIRNAAFVAAVLLVVVLGVGLLYVVRTPVAPVALASPTTSPTSTPAPSVATPSPSPTGLVYVNQTFGFTVRLPAPYRKSARLSLANTGSQNPAAADSFTARTESEEAPLAGQTCETTCAVRNYVAFVEIYTGVSQTPRQWYTSRASATGQRIDDVTVDGRAAIRVTNGAEIFVPVQLIVKDGDRMFRVGYQITRDPVPLGASQDKLEQILASFRFMP